MPFVYLSGFRLNQSRTLAASKQVGKDVLNFHNSDKKKTSVSGVDLSYGQKTKKKKCL
jgi:hypothetical protein